MKDFVKWLGVNEKIAKLIVWILIIMVFLVLTNSFLDSIGFSNYKITYDNLRQVNTSVIIEYSIVWIMAILSFYSITLLVFRIKEAKNMFKYVIVYLIFNALVASFNNQVVLQFFLFAYIIGFFYFYSGKKIKYLLYGICAYVFAGVVQGVWYVSKAKFVDTTSLNDTTKILLSLDYFIIMAIIILVKEIYLKKRSEKVECLEEKENQDVHSGLVTSKKKEH